MIFRLDSAFNHAPTVKAGPYEISLLRSPSVLLHLGPQPCGPGILPFAPFLIYLPWNQPLIELQLRLLCSFHRPRRWVALPPGHSALRGLPFVLHLGPADDCTPYQSVTPLGWLTSRRRPHMMIPVPARARPRGAARPTHYSVFIGGCYPGPCRGPRAPYPAHGRECSVRSYLLRTTAVAFKS